MKDTFAVELNGVVAVVTGAGRGAGGAIAVVLGEIHSRRPACRGPNGAPYLGSMPGHRR